MFFYGSLLSEQVFMRVIRPLDLGGRVEYIHADLEGYRRFKVRGAKYPGIVAADNSKVIGACIELPENALGQQCIDKLDLYEGVAEGLYARRELDVRILDQQQYRKAYTYVFTGQVSAITNEPWHSEHFNLRIDEFVADEAL